MPETNAILTALSSFGAAEVRRHGQPWFARLAEQAGADGVEVGGQLFVDAAAELLALADVAARLQRRVYSSPEGLWSDTGVFDPSALERGLRAATRLGAPHLKMSIGGWRPCSTDSVVALRDHLADTPVELVIDNDQTATAGTLRALTRFFEAAKASGLALGMTFDIGNWHWTVECPLQAASALAPRVHSVRCKGVQRRPQRWAAVPIADSAAPWRGALGAMPRGVPWAIEYPLAGDHLLEVTHHAVEQLRGIAKGLV